MCRITHRDREAYKSLQEVRNSGCAGGSKGYVKGRCSIRNQIRACTGTEKNKYLAHIPPTVRAHHYTAACRSEKINVIIRVRPPAAFTPSDLAQGQSLRPRLLIIKRSAFVELCGLFRSSPRVRIFDDPLLGDCLRLCCHTSKVSLSLSWGQNPELCRLRRCGHLEGSEHGK